MVLTNAFGAADLAIGGLCIALALRRGFWTLLLAGLAAYLWISPWVPPSLIHLILQDKWGARGFLHTTLRSYLGVAAVAVWFSWRCGRWRAVSVRRSIASRSCSPSGCA